MLLHRRKPNCLARALLRSLVGSGFSGADAHGAVPAQPAGDSFGCTGRRKFGSRHRQLVGRGRSIGLALQLIHIDGDHLHVRHVPFAVVRITHQKAVGEGLHLRLMAIHAAEDRQAQRALGGRLAPEQRAIGQHGRGQARNILQNGGGSALASPVGGFGVGLVVYGCQVRRLYALHALVSAVDAGDQEAAGQQRSLDRILRLAGEEHLLGVVDQRAEETGQRGAAVGHGQIHLGGEGFRLPLDRRGEGEVAHQAVHQQHGAAQPVAMLIVVGNRIGHQGPHLLEGGKHIGKGGSLPGPAWNCGRALL